MDNQINELLYTKRIAETMKNWKSQGEKKFTSHANIIGKDGTAFYVGDDGKLHQRLDDKTIKFAKIVCKANEHLLSPSECPTPEVRETAEVREFV